MPVDPDELDYLRRVELLARELVECASNEEWLSYEPDSDDATPLQRAVNELARSIRHYHFEGDGCSTEKPKIGLGGAALIRPGLSSGVEAEGYVELCARLGVEARPEGWALWHTWDGQRRGEQLTLVTTCLATTEGLLANWSRRIRVDPEMPDRAQIAAVVRGWTGPSILSPAQANELGRDGT